MKKIEEMFAFVASDALGEGLVGMRTQDGWMPLVGADMDRVESLKAIARQVSAATGQKVHLLKFSKREDLGEI